MRGAERGIACRADHRVVIDLATHHHRLAPPEAGHPRPFAGRPRRRLAGCLGIRCLGGRRAAVRAAVRVDFAAVLGVPVLLPLVTAPIRIVARWRTRAVRRVLLRLLDQGSCDLDQLPRQFLQLSPGQIPEPLAVHVAELICSEMRHIACRIPSFAAPQTNSWGSVRKPTNCCISDSPSLPRQRNPSNQPRTPLRLAYDPQPCGRGCER